MKEAKQSLAERLKTIETEKLQMELNAFDPTDLRQRMQFDASSEHIGGIELAHSTLCGRHIDKESPVVVLPPSYRIQGIIGVDVFYHDRAVRGKPMIPIGYVVSWDAEIYGLAAKLHTDTPLGKGKRHYIVFDDKNAVNVPGEGVHYIGIVGEHHGGTTQQQAFDFLRSGGRSWECVEKPEFGNQFDFKLSEQEALHGMRYGWTPWRRRRGEPVRTYEEHFELDADGITFKSKPTYIPIGAKPIIDDGNKETEPAPKLLTAIRIVIDNRLDNGYEAQ